MLNPELRAGIKQREEICKNCPFNSVKAVENGTYDNPLNRTDLHCSLCLCTISLLTRCLTCDCSLKEYNQEHGTNIPVRWSALI